LLIVVQTDPKLIDDLQMKRDTVSRFSNRVENYVKYRPQYPPGMLRLLEEKFNINNSLKVADIGSGTGISSEQFVEAAYDVFGVDPNSEMRMCAEKYFAGRKNYFSVNGSAEATTLDADSMDIIVAGQAFHWFDKAESRVEFRRIIKSEGMVFLIWNKKVNSEGFMDLYFGLLKKYGTDYENVKHENFDSHTISDFFAPMSFELITMSNEQLLDYEGLKGRLLSSSYIPTEGEKYERMLEELKSMYSEFNQNGIIRIDYNTEIYAGKLK